MGHSQCQAHRLHEDLGLDNFLDCELNLNLDCQNLRFDFHT